MMRSHDHPGRGGCGYFRRLTLVLGYAGALPILGAAETTPRDGVNFFETKIRPVLAENCYRCHAADAEKIESEFLLDTREGIRKGGASGRDAVIPGNVAGSRLIEAIRYGNEDLQMPPKHRLPDEVVAAFEKWIAMGAPDPRDGFSKLPRELAAEDHWAFQAPRAPPLPKVRDREWPRDRIDHFVLAKLEAAGLTPSPQAGRRTLIRRATLELTGLPPTPEEIAAFLAHEGSDEEAFANLVDRLLDSPAFGERWARHWLDVARYAESSGFSRNMLYPYAWRYRDYVIDSFNRDKPFDQFVREQVAGDLLPAESAEESDAQAIATGFLTIGPKTLNESSVLLFNLNVADDQIDATCRAFLALTANCARCHDHKYDPIPTRDYYALAGIFTSSVNLAGVETNNRNEHGEAFPLGAEGWNRLARIEEETKRADEAQKVYLDFVKKRNAIREPLEKEGVDWKKNPTPELERAETEVQRHQDIVQEAKAAIPAPPELAMAVVEGAPPGPPEETEGEEGKADAKKSPPVTIGDSPLFEKGNPESPLDAVPRGVLTLFDYDAPPVGEHESGRLQFANWLTDERNPLTARVFVNRVWHHLFGTGLVETVDNFGMLAAAPSHPALLDDLALRFVREGWSTKHLIREIMLSRAYMMSSRHDKRGAAADPSNRLLWRFAPQRLEGEAIRDSILFVGGQLDREAPRGSQVAEIAAAQPKAQAREIGRRDYYNKEVNYDVTCRSIYLPMARDAIPSSLTIFDAADPNLVAGARTITTVPAQGLFLMNSPMVLEQCKHAAARVLARPEAERLRFAVELTLGRIPTADERALIDGFLASASGDAAESWAQICQTLICSGEFRMIY